MDPERWQQVEQLYHQVLEREESARDVWLKEACAGDETLHREVQSLLAYDRQAENFMERPLVEVVAHVVAGRNLPEERAKLVDEALVGQVVSHYRLVEKLGAGGMGVVYRAEDTVLGRFVAVKFLPQELCQDREGLERFRREACAASAIDHPNICTVHDFGEDDSRPFIIMQLLEGQTLKDSISGRPLENGALLDLATQIADALAAAHARGIIHRDIKPANIFVTHRGEAKILDFGLAKLTQRSFTAAHGDRAAEGVTLSGSERSHATVSAGDSHLTRTGAEMGTAAYMSPEQVRGEKLDARTDLFSFGLVLYEMATGQRAFGGDTAATLRDAILNGTPAAAKELNPELPPKLEEIIDKALAKGREARYQSAAEMLADLGRLRGEARAHRVQLQRQWALAAVALVVVVVGFAWFLTRHLQAPTKLIERQLTFKPFENYVTDAAISPDGARIAYKDQTGLYLYSIDSGETHAVSLPAGFQDRTWDVEWFPDGKKLILGGQDLWTITMQGSARLLYRHGQSPAISPDERHRHGQSPAISPDGRLIAFTSKSDPTKPPEEVLVSQANGEAPRTLVAAEESQNVFSPAFSPDARWIAYVRKWKATPQSSYSSAIEVQPVGGGPAKTLVAESSLPKSSSLVTGCLRWSPDWRLLFCTGQAAEWPSAEAAHGLWAVRVEPRQGETTGKPERLTQWIGFAILENLTITADGKRLSFVKDQSWHDVYLGELGPDGSSMKPLRRFTLDNRGSLIEGWTPDGQSILFSSSRNGKNAVFRQGLNGNVAEEVVEGPGDDFGANLSPDGSWILYFENSRTAPGASPSPTRLMRRSVGGGSPQIVLEEPRGQNWFWCPPKPDSRCVLSQPEGKDFVFYSLDPVRGKGKRLGEIEASSAWWNVAPDGSRLALVDPVKHKGQIEVLTFRDRAWHTVSVEPVWGDLESISWAADGKGFFVTSWLLDSYNLLHVTLTGKAKVLLRNGHGQWTVNPLPSPDGKYLAFQGKTIDRNVWMIDNF